MQGETPKGNEAAAGIVILLVLASVFVAYKIGHGPVGRLEAEVADHRRAGEERTSEVQAKLDVIRLSALEVLSSTEAATRGVAGQSAASAYAFGGIEMCQEILGQNSLRCDSLYDVFGGPPRYPGDPGSIPRTISKDLFSTLSREFEGLQKILCTDGAWPYRGIKVLHEECRDYGVTVAKKIAGVVD